MKTLVIHPYDRTTHFLKIIYKDKGYTVLTDEKHYMTKSVMMRAIQNHDRIIMMGHGCPFGLLGYTRTFMEADFIKLLKTKECVCIWCNADKYVLREGIKGFYTGMFISEVGEARFYGIDVGQKTIDYSNNLFVNLMKDVIDSPVLLNEIKSGYSSESNPVIQFNNERLYYRNNETILTSRDIGKLLFN